MSVDPTPEAADFVYQLIRGRRADRYKQIADAVGHGDAQRILRRLVLDGKIEWASNGWLSCSELAEVIPIRRPLTEKYGPLPIKTSPAVYRGIAEPGGGSPAGDAVQARSGSSTPHTESSTESSESSTPIYGPFGREPQHESPTGVILPTAPPVHPQDVLDVPAPVLEAEPDPKPAESDLMRAATQAVLDNLSDDEPF